MKKIVVYLLIFVFSLALLSSSVNASSYEYIIDNANLFDDSTEMISMAKEIRSKLDFDIHIYSLENLEASEEIIDQHIQNSSVLLIFISEEKEMSWYSGSSVQRTIRDIDFENLFSSFHIKSNQYTQAVNFILSKILSIYVYEVETIYNYTEYSGPSVVEEQNWFVINFNYCINFIRTHPVRILIVIVLLIGCIIYYDRRRYKE